jgi:hypothetical protein
MIALIEPLPIGNALRVFLDPIDGATSWRILRKDADTFTGETDPDAALIYEGKDKSALDVSNLMNGATYYYRAYYFVASQWVASETVSAVPAATYADRSTDPMTIVRDRLDAGLAVELDRGALKHDDGHIPVLTAPPIFSDTRWPVVTVHLQSDAPHHRGIGEMIDPDELDDDDGLWSESEGWLSRVQLVIAAWTLNPDGRIDLRKALRRIIVGNLPVFDDAGMVNIDVTMQDVDFIQGEYPAPVYQVMCSLSCLAPVRVSDEVAKITDVETTAEAV